MNTAAIVQARMGSTRLPGKVLMPLRNKPVLWHVNERLKHSRNLNDIIIATTDLAEDDPIENFCSQHNIKCYRGSSSDVLSRYYYAAKFFNAGLIVRITADCPLIDPRLIDSMLEVYEDLSLSGSAPDYMSNVHPRTFPRGLDAEIFTFAALQKAFSEADKEFEREHVTPYFYQTPDRFKTYNFTSVADYSNHRWTVDTDEDFRLIAEIYSELYRENEIIGTDKILELFNSRPELFKINENIRQKELGK